MNDELEEYPAPSSTPEHLVLYSGGLVSWAVAYRLLNRDDGPDKLTLLFTDTKIEDEDLYRFLDETVEHFGDQVEFIRLADGRTPFEVFRDEKFLGNSRVDPCSRVLKRELTRQWMNDFCDPDITTVYIGFDWEEMHRYERAKPHWEPWTLKAPLTQKPYWTRGDITEELDQIGIEIPQLYQEGFPHNNCFHGSTKFITDTGIKTLQQCKGQEVRVLGSNAAWRDAQIKSFGEQPLMRVSLSRFGRSYEIMATPDHKWFVRSGRNKRREVRTLNLEPEQRLVSMHGQLNANVRPSPFGIARGIVYGDGTRPEQYYKSPARIVLCGDKDQQLLKWFQESPTQDHPYGIKVTDLPRFWKDLPSLEDASKSYLYGWLAGYFAADGSAGNGEYTLSSASLESLEFAESVAAILSISTNPIRSYEREGIDGKVSTLHELPFVGSSLRRDFFLIDAHRQKFLAANESGWSRPAEWKIESVEHTSQIEEVYCAVVPEGNAFTLRHNIYTHNCGGACVKAGQGHFAHLYKARPETFKEWEEKEQEMREYLDKDVSILKDKRGGESSPLTLRMLRERIESDGQVDMFSWGGCACFFDPDDQ